MIKQAIELRRVNNLEGQSVPVAVPADSAEVGGIIALGQRPLNQKHMTSLYDKLTNAYTNLLTAGGVILEYPGRLKGKDSVFEQMRRGDERDRWKAL
jgi:hypothetical protein